MGTSPGPSMATGINHLVLNVRDIEASHRFWTEVMGWAQCGQIDPKRGIMRFYQATPTKHHDLALVQVDNVEEQAEILPWTMAGPRAGVNHIAIGYPDRESFLQQLAHLETMGVEFLVRGDHGMTHSAYISDPDGHGIEILYELPMEIWEADVNGALNYFKPLPLTGPESLKDNDDYKVFTAPAS